MNLGDSAAVGTPAVTIGTINMAINTAAGGAVEADLNITGGNVTIGTGSGTAINMANAGTSRTVTSDINLTGGTIEVTGNIVRTGGAGTENATVSSTVRKPRPERQHRSKPPDHYSCSAVGNLDRTRSIERWRGPR